MRQLIESRPVNCKGSKRDRYRRLLAVCFVGDVDLGREMVRAGHAVPYKRGTGRYSLQASEAKRAKRGMWQGPICDPYDFRRGRC